MTKKIRFLLCALAIIIGSAGAMAQEPAEIESAEDLKDVCEDVDMSEEDYFKLMADIETSQTFEVNRSLTLDLNGHSITNSGDYCFSIQSGYMLTIIDNSTGQTKGSINYTGEGDKGAIFIESGGALIASGITITATNGDAVNNNEGAAILSGCIISGNKGIANFGTMSVTGCSISGNETAIQNEKGTLSINMGDNPSACTISGGDSGIYNQMNGTIAIGSGVSIKSCSWGGITNIGGTVMLNAWPAFGTGDEKNGCDIWLMKGNQIAIGANITAAPAAPITVRVTDNFDNDLGATDLPQTITTGYAAHMKDAQSAVIDPASVFAYYTDTPGYMIALGGDNNSEAVLAYDAGGNTGGDIADITVTGPTESGDEVSWTFTMPDYSVKAEVEYVDAAFSLTRTVNEQDMTIGYYETLAEAVAAAAKGDGIEQLADFETADMVTIDKYVHLNLNGHTYTSTNTTAAITVAESVSFHLNCNINDKDINGTLTNSSTTGGKGIIVEYGGNLNAEYVSIVSASDDAIYNKGNADFYSSSITGKRGIYDLAESSFNNTSISATDYGIYEAGFDANLYSGTSISGCSKAGVYCSGDYVCFRGMPTFGTGDDANGTDIWLANGTHIEFGSYFTYTPGPKITVRATDSEGNDIVPDESRLIITAGYADHFTDEYYQVIEPRNIFAWYDNTAPIGISLDGDEAILEEMNADNAIFVLNHEFCGLQGKTEYFMNLASAVAAAHGGDEIIQQTNYETADMVTIDKEVNLYLDGHNYTSSHATAAITVAEDVKFYLDGYNGNSEDNSKLQNISTTGGKCIIVESGGQLGASVMDFASASDYAIYNKSMAILNFCSVTGKSGIYTSDDCTISYSSISDAEYGIYVAGGNATVFSGCNFSRCSTAGIACIDGQVTLEATPTFGTGSDTNGEDIWLFNGTHIEFDNNFTYTPGPKITVYVSESENQALDIADMPLTITANYADYFTDESGMIDPNTVFAWYDKTQPVAFGFDGSGDVRIGTGTAIVNVPDATTGGTTTFYDNIQDAADAALAGYVAADGDTPAIVPRLTLLDDIEVDEEWNFEGDGATDVELIIDLNGHKVSRPDGNTLYIDEHVSMTIDDSGEGGSIESKGNAAISSEGSLHILGGTFIAPLFCIENNGTLTVSGGTFDNSDGGYAINNDGPLTLTVLPTFYHGSTEGCIDILLSSTDPITFTKAITEAPESPIVIDMSETFNEPITSGYGTYVRNDNGVIDHADVFVSYYDNVNMRLNDDNEIIVSQMVPMPYEFPVGNSTYYSNTGLKLMEGYENLKIYTVTGISGNTVVLTEIKSRTFPANTPVILSNTGDKVEEASFYVAGDNYDEADFAAALAADLGTETVAEEFKGTATDIDAIGFTADTEYYGLRVNDFVRLRTDGPVGAHHCWLEISKAIEIGGAGASRMTIQWPGEDTAMAITGAGVADKGAGTASDDALYSIDGRRVAGTPKKGLYIRGGQKVVVR